MEMASTCSQKGLEAKLCLLATHRNQARPWVPSLVSRWPSASYHFYEAFNLVEQCSNNKYLQRKKTNIELSTANHMVTMHRKLSSTSVCACVKEYSLLSVPLVVFNFCSAFRFWVWFLVSWSEGGNLHGGISLSLAADTNYYSDGSTSGSTLERNSRAMYAHF